MRVQEPHLCKVALNLDDPQFEMFYKALAEAFPRLNPERGPAVTVTQY